ncbi:hypothetical protein V8C44DRAFT_336240 [Trichoderma aethiopicum]
MFLSARPETPGRRDDDDAAGIGCCSPGGPPGSLARTRRWGRDKKTRTREKKKTERGRPGASKRMLLHPVLFMHQRQSDTASGCGLSTLLLSARMTDYGSTPPGHEQSQQQGPGLAATLASPGASLFGYRQGWDGHDCMPGPEGIKPDPPLCILASSQSASVPSAKERPQHTHRQTDSTRSLTHPLTHSQAHSNPRPVEHSQGNSASKTRREEQSGRRFCCSLGRLARSWYHRFHRFAVPCRGASPKREPWRKEDPTWASPWERKGQN